MYRGSDDVSMQILEIRERPDWASWIKEGIVLAKRRVNKLLRRRVDCVNSGL